MKRLITAWKRPTELTDIAPYMFFGKHEKPTYFAVNQGKFDNSGFLAALGAVARSPRAIYRLI